MYKKVILAIVLLFIVFIVVGCGSAEKDDNKENGADKVATEIDFRTKETEHFNFYYTETDESSIDDISSYLEKKYNKIINDLKPGDLPKIKVFIYPDLGVFHKAIEKPNAPDWLVSVISHRNEILKIVSPNNPGPVHDYNVVLQSAVYSISGMFTAKTAGISYKEIPPWLTTSIALYEADMTRNIKQFDFMKNDDYPHFLEMTYNNNGDSKKLLNQIGYTIIEYVVDTWGISAVRDLIDNKGDVQKVLSVSSDDFQQGWYEYVKEKYNLTHDLDFETKETEHFNFYYTNVDDSSIGEISSTLEDNFDRIVNDLKPKSLPKFSVRIYPDLETYHKATGRPNAPDWSVGGFSGNREINMVSPNNPGPTHTYEEMLVVAVHEFAHGVTRHVAKDSYKHVPKWLKEAVALYEANQIRDSNNLEFMRKGNYPRFLQIVDNKDDYKVIYSIGYTIIEYVVDKWDIASVRELIKNKGDVQKVLGVSPNDFQQGWYNFVKEKYLEE
ncbi:MAG: hypothetical protein K9L17_05550 [Clostridiales bacterium]|nr:hypothetical protein [Clostridiales bacterium]MCF8022136.1 hypothetical protein [Clostridiales bacterium]